MQLDIPWNLFHKEVPSNKSNSKRCSNLETVEYCNNSLRPVHVIVLGMSEKLVLLCSKLCSRQGPYCHDSVLVQ